MEKVEPIKILFPLLKTFFITNAKIDPRLFDLVFDIVGKLHQFLIFAVFTIVFFDFIIFEVDDHSDTFHFLIHKMFQVVFLILENLLSLRQFRNGFVMAVQGFSIKIEFVQKILTKIMVSISIFSIGTVSLSLGLYLRFSISLFVVQGTHI